MTTETIHIGEFIVDSLLGEGGMGVIYRARQVALDRWVAIKILSCAKENPAFTERFYREARSVAKLVHPNIIQILTVGEWQKIPYYAMEYVEGMDIECLLRGIIADPLTLDETLEIICSVVKALALAAEYGIVHRDIKPANIMIAKSGLVKIMDFGLARNIATEFGLSQQNSIIGTPTYMSPEQSAGKPIDARSDQYSLGCVMYECLCGRPPFTANNAAALIFKHMYESPEPISKFREVPPDVENICVKMMAKAPDDRFRSPQEILEALAAIPCNLNLAEIALSKRVVKLLQDKKPLERNRSETIIAATSTAPQTSSSVDVIAPQTSPSVPITAPQASPPEDDKRDFFPQNASSQNISNMRITPSVLRRTPAFGLTLRPDSSGKLRTIKIHEIFLKLPDGRWSYKIERKRCIFATGLAADVLAPPEQKIEGLGDCLLCNNWNKRVGCVLAYSQELENSFRGLRLLTEQAIAWAGAGRFDKAIATLDNYIKTNSEDPDGYRELARLYDRPEYHGKDKRRGSVLYARFLELARKVGGYSNIELSRAEERVAVLKSAPVEQKTSSLADTGIPFQAFYRGSSICFCYGYLGQDKLILARAGEVDPDSGIQASAMGGVLGKAISVFWRFKSEQTKKDEMAAVKNELLRLANQPIEMLAQEPACILSLDCAQIVNTFITVDDVVHIWTVMIATAEQTHQLLFTETMSFRAEQCHALLQRKINQNAKR